ncbi:MAG: cobyrinate a,c-diamide synthase [Gemmatimonadaceae bacterium]|nr:cobyrinate a,c-diamide synthase [Gloeobacterales cyanobacterium ES-bin-141]
MAILIAAPASATGKTTITLAILAFLQKHGLHIRSFKVGPDYIDPMFHREVTGSPCINLDPFLTDEDYVRRTFAHHCQDKDGAVIEGVMGLFDGQAGRADFASTAHVSRLIDATVVLVVDGSRTGYSMAALLHGFRYFDPRVQIGGVILNRVNSERHRDILVGAVESVGLSVLGVIPRTEAITLGDRHLGLVPVGELTNFHSVRQQLAHLAEHLDWSKLLPMLRVIPAPASPRWQVAALPTAVIGVAWDRAFNFYYQDNLELLQELGAQLRFFSPLADEWPECDGYLLGGGFPELFAATLVEQSNFFGGLRRSVQQGRPLYAECGGLMVLGKTLQTFDGQHFAMAGLLGTHCRMEERSVLGYREATVVHASCAVVAGENLRGHEFHRSRLEPATPTHPLYCFDDRQEGWTSGCLHASYLHLHWGTQISVARRFMGSTHLYPSGTIPLPV